jgi:HTH-type transcriptional regulator, repressor for puuD
LRKERGLSQREVAERAGLSPNAVSLVERDEISPSVATLQCLARALSVRMSYFFDGPDEASVVCAKAGVRPRIISEGVTIEGIGLRLPDQQVEPFYLTLAPHADCGRTQVAHVGQELVCCLCGHVEYGVDGVFYELDPGDLLLFNAELPHCWRNTTDETAQLLLVLQSSAPAGNLARRHFVGHPSVARIG